MERLRAGGTPAEYVDGLLARAQNGFEIDEAVRTRLHRALMYQSDLRSCRQDNEPPGPAGYSTYRHVFLLPDGSSRTLWELEHVPAPGARPLYELYTDEEALVVAECRAQERIDGGRPEDGAERARPAGRPGGLAGEAERWDIGALLLPEQFPPTFAPSASPRALRRAYMYVADDSADHARRVLRRAENPDRPGEDTERLLATAFAHDIVLATKPRRRSEHSDATWCRFYEHAFLLAGGDEIVLWELEHNLTSDGRLVCEVYLDEAAAELAADRHARALGVDL
ncbi:DUF6227 family protein [Streptomyces sp. B1866]|uniref:DUF6227 family protein n=1 Tax=Streptomyces sp. B1866 TaxID=3075431 RepID=UPI00288EFF56|nr:DUF6227 family protein [Streptomyces sp. B1866]MDT3395560.1 DUF6227 family protein [Streptomyces sp. B1866]